MNVWTLELRRGPRIFYAIDFEKTYDHVNWGYLDWVMQKMGFGIKCWNWMKIHVSSPSYSILVNGLSKGFFKSSRDLREGDPLSPYLFIMVTEILSRMVAKADSLGMLKGFCSVGDSSIPFI